jgi:hypothetical protein
MQIEMEINPVPEESCMYLELQVEKVSHMSPEPQVEIELVLKTTKLK